MRLRAFEMAGSLVWRKPSSAARTLAVLAVQMGVFTVPVLSQHTLPVFGSPPRVVMTVATARKGRAKRGRTRDKIIVFLKGE